VKHLEGAEKQGKTSRLLGMEARCVGNSEFSCSGSGQGRTGLMGKSVRMKNTEDLVVDMELGQEPFGSRLGACSGGGVDGSPIQHHYPSVCDRRRRVPPDVESGGVKRRGDQ